MLTSALKVLKITAETEEHLLLLLLLLHRNPEADSSDSARGVGFCYYCCLFSKKIITMIAN